jgi:hypothetical protein
MTKSHPATTREAIILFHFADRIKAELIIASRLLGAVLPLKGEERAGGGRVFLEYLKGLQQEINLGSAQIADPEMIRVQTVITGLLGMADSGMYSNIQEHLTWILTVMTTYAQRGLEMLLKEKLL